MKIQAVTLFRIKKNSMGAVPGAFHEGMIVGMTDLEIETLKKNPHLHECFEEISIKQRTAYAESNPGETAAADTPAPVSP